MRKARLGTLGMFSIAALGTVSTSFAQTGTQAGTQNSGTTSGTVVETLPGLGICTCPGQAPGTAAATNLPSGVTPFNTGSSALPGALPSPGIGTTTPGTLGSDFSGLTPPTPGAAGIAGAPGTAAGMGDPRVTGPGSGNSSGSLGGTGIPGTTVGPIVGGSGTTTPAAPGTGAANGTTSGSGNDSSFTRFR